MGFCLSLGSHVNMGRSWLPQVVSKTAWTFRWGRDQIVPGSTFWWIPFFMTYKYTYIYYIYITHTHTLHIYVKWDTQWESCMGNLYADVYIKFSQSILNQIWVIDFMSVCADVCALFYCLKKVCVCVSVCAGAQLLSLRTWQPVCQLPKADLHIHNYEHISDTHWAS